MPRSFSAYLVIDTLGVAALNAALNAVYTSWLWYKLPILSLAGPEGLATDLALTPLFITFLATILGTGPARRKLQAGAVVRWERAGAMDMLALLPSGIFQRAIVLTLLSTLLFAAPLYSALLMSGAGTLSLAQAVAAKIVITLVFSFILVPLVLCAASSDRTRGIGVTG